MSASGGKKRSAVADYLVYLVVRLVVCVVQTLSWEQARAFAGLLAWLVYHVDKRHREVARANLRKGFPGRHTEEELDRLVRGVYRHYATLLVEIILIPRKLHVDNYKRHVDLFEGEATVEALLSDRPLLIVTGHFGNWELAGYFLGLTGFTTHAIARRLDNPHLDRFLLRFRQHTGQTILDKKADYDRMLEVLRAGGVLATLGDQDAGARGLFVDFFGRPASTHKAVALMALEYQVPIVVAMTPKVGEPFRYHILTDDVIFPEDYKDRPDAVKAITQRFTASIERFARQYPEQYFWLHNRWKHEPPQKKARKALAA